MNIFKRIYRFFFTLKKKPEQVVEKKELVFGTMSIPVEGDLIIPDEIVETTHPALEKPVVRKTEQLIFNTINEAKTALSQEWNKRKKKNIYDDYRIARDYKKIDQLHDIINGFKAAQG